MGDDGASSLFPLGGKTILLLECCIKPLKTAEMLVMARNNYSLAHRPQHNWWGMLARGEVVSCIATSKRSGARCRMPRLRAAAAFVTGMGREAAEAITVCRPVSAILLTRRSNALDLPPRPRSSSVRGRRAARSCPGDPALDRQDPSGGQIQGCLDDGGAAGRNGAARWANRRSLARGAPCGRAYCSTPACADAAGVNAGAAAAGRVVASAPRSLELWGWPSCRPFLPQGK